MFPIIKGKPRGALRLSRSWSQPCRFDTLPLNKVPYPVKACYARCTNRSQTTRHDRDEELHPAAARECSIYNPKCTTHRLDKGSLMATRCALPHVNRQESTRILSQTMYRGARSRVTSPVPQYKHSSQPPSTGDFVARRLAWLPR